MSEKLDQVTKAIADAWGQPPQELARLAILAMREPTEGMVDAGTLGGDISLEHVRDAWQAMIDEVLKP